MTIYFAPEAEEDFAVLIGYLHERSPSAAADLGRRVFAIIDRLASGELEGARTTLESGDAVRSWAVPPVRVYYQRRVDALWVIRIYHQAQQPITR